VTFARPEQLLNGFYFKERWNWEMVHDFVMLSITFRFLFASEFRQKVPSNVGRSACTAA
jgi:hypothetical protein